MRKNKYFIVALGVVALLTAFGFSQKGFLLGQDVMPTISFAEADETYQISNFYIETSWLSGEESRKTESFDSETKENKPWYSKDSNGNYVLKCLKTDGNRTEWKEKKQSALIKGKRMHYMASVDAIPENGVTIAQIHNRGDGVRRPWLRVYIDKDRKMKMKVTTNSPANDKGTYDKFTGTEYNERADFKLSITYTGDGAHVEVTNEEEGTTILNETVYPTFDWDEFKDTFYFKAGVYTEGNNTFSESTFKYFYFNE